MKQQNEMQEKLNDIVRSEKSLLEKALEMRELYRSNKELFERLNIDDIVDSPLGKFVICEWDAKERGESDVRDVEK